MNILKGITLVSYCRRTFLTVYMSSASAAMRRRSHEECAPRGWPALPALSQLRLSLSHSVSHVALLKRAMNSLIV